MGNKEYTFNELIFYSLSSITIGLISGIIFSISNLNTLNDLFSSISENSDKYDNLDKWNSLVLETSLFDFYFKNVYKYTQNQQAFLFSEIKTGLKKIDDLEKKHIAFINNFIYNSSYNSYNKALFDFETNLYFQKLRFMFVDYTCNNVVFQNNFNASLTGENDNYLREFFDKKRLPNSFSTEYRKKLNKNLYVGGFIKPFEIE